MVEGWYTWFAVTSRVDARQAYPQNRNLLTTSLLQENFSRFVGSLKKKFVEQEVESLQQRTYATSKQGTPFCECLVGGGVFTIASKKPEGECGVWAGCGRRQDSRVRRV